MTVYYDSNSGEIAITGISIEDFQSLLEMMKLGSVASYGSFSIAACNTGDKKTTERGRLLVKKIQGFHIKDEDADETMSV